LHLGTDDLNPGFEDPWRLEESDTEDESEDLSSFKGGERTPIKDEKSSLDRIPSDSSELVNDSGNSNPKEIFSVPVDLTLEWIDSRTDKLIDTAIFPAIRPPGIEIIANPADSTVLDVWTPTLASPLETGSDQASIRVNETDEILPSARVVPSPGDLIHPTQSSQTLLSPRSHSLTSVSPCEMLQSVSFLFS